MNVFAKFVRSAAAAGDLPRDGLAQIALVGRSNVGKSSLINALVRRRVARTSAAPGKTRLLNVYRIARGGGDPFYIVDLPGYGYARGGANEFASLVDACFGDRRSAEGSRSSIADGARGVSRAVGALLLVDARHPGLESDLAAWRWLQAAVERCAIVATKTDKLARGERIRAHRTLESVFEGPVLPFSAVTGEGLEELWKLIDRLRHRNSNPGPSRNPAHRARGGLSPSKAAATDTR